MTLNVREFTWKLSKEQPLPSTPILRWFYLPPFHPPHPSMPCRDLTRTRAAFLEFMAKRLQAGGGCLTCHHSGSGAQPIHGQKDRPCATGFPSLHPVCGWESSGNEHFQGGLLDFKYHKVKPGTKQRGAEWTAGTRSAAASPTRASSTWGRRKRC